MSVLSLSYWESDVYWRQNNKHFAQLAPQNGRKQLIWRNYVTVTLCIETRPFWATVTSNSSPYGTGPLSCLSVCNVGVFWPNGWVVQDTTWYGGTLGPGGIVLDWDSAPPHGKRHSTERDTADNSLPRFSTHFALARPSVLATAEILFDLAKPFIY